MNKFCVNCEHRIYGINQSGVSNFRCIETGKLLNKFMHIPTNCRKYKDRAGDTK
jgi:hypothetical protein